MWIEFVPLLVKKLLFKIKISNFSSFEFSFFYYLGCYIRVLKNKSEWCSLFGYQFQCWIADSQNQTAQITKSGECFTVNLDIADEPRGRIEGEKLAQFYGSKGLTY